MSYENQDVKPPLHSIEMLKAEHFNIVRACGEAKAMAQSLLRSEKVPAEALAAITRFFAEYVGERHRRKERDLLFPFIERDYGPEVLGASLRDHEEGCWWIRSLDQIARAYACGCGQSGKRWAETALRYVAMLEAQFEAEEHLLYPLAETAISPDEERTLSQAFEEVDNEADERLGYRAGKVAAA